MTENEEKQERSPDSNESETAVSLVDSSRGDEDERDEGEPPIPEKLPLLPVRESVAFPGTVMPLNVGREKSKRVLDLALASDHMIGVFTQRAAQTEDPRLDDLYRVGSACRILKMLKLPDGTETIIVHGVVRVGLETTTQETPYLEAKVHPREDSTETTTEIEALMHNVRFAAERVMQLSPNVPDEAKMILANVATPGALADFLAANLSLSVVHKQELLETFDVSDRLRKVYAALTSQLEVLELSSKLQQQVKEQMDKSQREYYLREQMKAIQSELGQGDARASTTQRLKKEVAESGMPETVAEVANREVERMDVIPQASPEYSVALDYVEWLIALPWAHQTEDNLDLDRAERILETDHYGLSKIKRRILEFLAVRKLAPEGRASILCFAGPPGVGKTSLGKSIARALGRKFIRMSLGGVRDEAEIRGHRRTYVGALPGRIIQEIKKCGSRNPVFMLDEVDKIGADFRGDPASALLEVLDPAQNDTFTDHYLDVPFDLSSVLFIATANYMDPVPAPLRDRMEVITLSSYTQHEKLQIAKNYLVPRQLVENGLSADRVRFNDKAIELIISGYTREAGVRELERQIGAVCRARAARIVRGEEDRLTVTPNVVSTDLGPIKYVSEIAAREDVAGVATGLAYTSVGGDILFIEASRMPGSGHLKLTGQVGDVMRESAEAAYSLIRSRAKKLRISTDAIRSHDLHVHVPAGAVPKDGPSAGVAIFAAMLSAIRGKHVDRLTAMTGEITLRGNVLPVGGIKEKFLAAHRAGIRRVIFPESNKKDLVELPPEVHADLKLVPVKTIDDAIKTAFSKLRQPAPERPATVSARKRKTRAKRSTSTASRSEPKGGKKRRKRPASPAKKRKKRPARRGSSGSGRRAAASKTTARQAASSRS